MKRQDKEIKSHLVYVTIDGRIPSTSANSVGVMNMCGQFSAQGVATTLMIPDHLGSSLEKLGFTGDLFAYYSVPARFRIVKFPNFFYRKIGYFQSVYAIAMCAYLRFKGKPLILSRSLDVAFWSRLFGLPVILESHNYSKFARHWLLPGWVRMTRRDPEKATMVVTTHAGEKSYVGNGVPESSIMVLPNGVDTNRFETDVSKEEIRKSLGLPEKENVVTFCGSLHEGRGVEEVIDCASRLNNVIFLIVGGSRDQVEKYTAYSSGKGIDNVVFSGHVSQDNVPRYLLAADVLLMPYTTRFKAHSFEYTSPMKMFEYLASGVPMVATDFPVLHEVLEHGRNVIFVKPDSGKSLASGVETLLTDPQFACRIASNAKSGSREYAWPNRASSLIAWQRNLGNLA